MLKRVHKFTGKWYEKYQATFQGKGILVVSNPDAERDADADVVLSAAEEDWSGTFRVGFLSSAGPGAARFQSLLIQAKKLENEEIPAFTDVYSETNWRLVVRTIKRRREFTIVRYKNIIFKSLGAEEISWKLHRGLAAFNQLSLLTRDVVRTLLLCLRKVCCNLDNHVITDYLLPYLNDWAEVISKPGDFSLKVDAWAPMVHHDFFKRAAPKRRLRPNVSPLTITWDDSFFATCDSATEIGLMATSSAFAMDCHFELVPSPTLFSVEVKQVLVRRSE